MSRFNRSSGFTLIELLVVVAVLAIFATLAAPSMSNFIEKRRVTAAAEAVRAQLQLGRSEAIKQSADVFASVVGEGENWYVGLSHDEEDDCANDAADCVISVGNTNVTQLVLAEAFPGVTVASRGSQPVFTARGIPPGFADRDDTEIDFTSAPGGWKVRVEVNKIGRISICAPASATNPGAYAVCN